MAVQRILPTEVALCSLGIKQVEPFMHHSIIVYRDEENGSLFEIHLGWHKYLICREFTDGYTIFPISVDHSDQKFVAALCGLIAEKKPEIPYGLRAHGIRVDPESGDVQINANGSGFTCASFILAIFSAVGFEIVKEGDWPEGVNSDWAAWVIDELRRAGADPSYIQAIEADAAGVKRFKPEEVVGASTVPDWPVGFVEATKVAEEVLTVIE